jgi:hypothetical protein
MHRNGLHSAFGEALENNQLVNPKDADHEGRAV